MTPPAPRKLHHVTLPDSTHHLDETLQTPSRTPVPRWYKKFSGVGCVSALASHVADADLHVIALQETMLPQMTTKVRGCHAVVFGRGEHKGHGCALLFRYHGGWPVAPRLRS